MTAFLGPLVVAGAFTAIQKDVKLFYSMVFLIQFAMLGTFVAQDLFLFYVFWETMLIPMFLMIGIWGGERRIYATIKFVLYTAFGSILMLAAVIYLVLSLQATTGITSFAFADLYQARLPVDVQGILLAAFGLSFAIKVPMVPLHTWLPDAHVEAPTAGSVILAGVLLKMGTYGFMKLGFPLFPDATLAFTPAIMLLVGDQHRLRRLRRAGPDRHQEDHRLLVDQPPGLRDAGSHQPQPLRHPGSGDPDGEPRPHRGRAVPDGRDDLRALPHPRTRGLRRPREDPPGLLGVLRHPHPRLDRPADDQRLHRRVPGAARRVRQRRGSSTSRDRRCRWCWRRPRSSGVVLGALYMLWFAAALPVRRREGAAPAVHRPRRARARDPRHHRRRGVRAGALPRRADAQDRARREAVSSSSSARRARARGWPTRTGRSSPRWAPRRRRRRPPNGSTR